MYDQVGKGLVHGFQKDSIQNALGAKVKNDFSDWRCEISIKITSQGQFVTITDSGTYGLTGPNLSVPEIQNRIDNKIKFPESDRLARISCSNESGGLSIGAGLFGIGKTMYAAASETCRYIFESLTIEGAYVCNYNFNNTMNDKALVENEAKLFITEETGLYPLSTIGTRIIILDPKKIILDSIHDNTLLKNAEETWWRIIPFFSENSGIFINGIKVKIPEYYEQNNFVKDHYEFIDQSEMVFDGYRTKKHGIFICKNIDEDYGGFHFYRRGMKIGNLKISIPEIESNNLKYSGFIEVQENWELELAEIEFETHYDVKKEKKNDRFYSNLKNFCTTYAKKKLTEWGYIKKVNETESQINNLVKDLKLEIENFFQSEGFEELGDGDEYEFLTLRVKNLVFPNPTELRTVYDGDSIKFDLSIKNTTQFNQKVKINVFTQTPDKKVLFKLIEQETTIEPKGIFTKDNLLLNINEENSLKFSENNLIITLNSRQLKKQIIKKITYYYSTPTKKNKDNDFELVLSNKKFPRLLDRKVLSDEIIHDITYTITNNTTTDTKVRLLVSTFNHSNNMSFIENVSQLDLTLNSISVVQSSPINIIFNNVLYDKKVKKGIIIVKAKLIVAESNSLFEKGEILNEYNFKVFYNTNERKGFEDSFTPEIINDETDHRRSFSEKRGNIWYIMLNIGHPEYKNYQKLDEKIQRLYLEKILIQEFTYIYIKEGRLKSIGLDADPTGEKSSYIEIFEQFNRKIELLWWKRCQHI
jgi:hypothetical protein